MANRLKDEYDERAWKLTWKNRRHRKGGCLACGGTSKAGNCGHSWRSWKYSTKSRKQWESSRDNLKRGWFEGAFREWLSWHLTNEMRNNGLSQEELLDYLGSHGDWDNLELGWEFRPFEVQVRATDMHEDWKELLEEDHVQV